MTHFPSMRVRVGAVLLLVSMSAATAMAQGSRTRPSASAVSRVVRDSALAPPSAPAPMPMPMPMPMPAPAPTGGATGPLRDEPPRPKLPEDARAQTPRLATGRLSNVRTKPGHHGVIITFDADLPRVSPHDFVRVEIRRERPTWIPSDRRWSYLQTSALGYCDVQMNEDGSFRAGPWEMLPPGLYYYLITVSERRSLPEAQWTGSFKTDRGPAIFQGQ